MDREDSTSATTTHDHLSGHVASTRLNALPFNTSEITQALYASTAPSTH